MVYGDIITYRSVSNYIFHIISIYFQVPTSLSVPTGVPLFRPCLSPLLQLIFFWAGHMPWSLEPGAWGKTGPAVTGVTGVTGWSIWAVTQVVGLNRLNQSKDVKYCDMYWNILSWNVVNVYIRYFWKPIPLVGVFLKWWNIVKCMEPEFSSTGRLLQMCAKKNRLSYGNDEMAQNPVPLVNTKNMIYIYIPYGKLILISLYWPILCCKNL